MSDVQPETEGLSCKEAALRLAQRLRREGKSSPITQGLGLLFRQFRSPLVLLLFGAMILSFVLGDRAEAVVVGAILLMSTSMGFWQEFRATNAVRALANSIGIRSRVLRDGLEVEVPREEVVEGDVVFLRAGDSIPGDGVLIQANDLHVDESALTGESFPVEKSVSSSNEIRAGTHVVGGTARALMRKTGKQTQMGAIAGSLRLRRPETDFETGLRRLGEVLLRTTLVFVVVVFAINAFLGRPAVESLLFTLALAVGMAPELMPAIVTITLARGARTMAREHVIVKRPSSIESFGGMTVLCADKTGTLTEGKMRLASTLDAAGSDSQRVLFLATLNSHFETGFSNPIDQALSGLCDEELAKWSKLDEVPYGFLRKRLSIFAKPPEPASKLLLVTKGAVPNVLAICSEVETPAGRVALADLKENLVEHFSKLSLSGKRVIAVASREFDVVRPIDKSDETDMIFEGFVVFEDPPKKDAAAMMRELARLGVDLKVVTGDNRFVACSLLRSLGIPRPGVLTGERIRQMKEMALVRQAPEIHVFAEIEPDQKERVVRALRRSGAVVGFLGDGINDAPPMHAADVAISVDGAVDVAREAADIVLMRHGLDVIAQGIRNGRAVFSNTLKYLRITTSANFGNMFSMAAAAWFLPFLPLLPRQVLLNNFLSDLPALALSTDYVDEREIRSPLSWDIHRLGGFMAVFGLASSVFDMLTFALLYSVLGLGESAFQTLWFVESLLTEVLVIWVLRTSGPALQSRPSLLLSVALGVVSVAAIGIGATGFPPFMGFVPAPMSGTASVLTVATLYLIATEATKRAWVRRGLSRTARQRSRGPASRALRR